MKAIAIQEFGDAEVMKLMELPKPIIKSNEILVKLKAAGVNPVDFKIRKGLLQGRLLEKFPIILGWDGAGIVETVGNDIKTFKSGDEIFTYARKEKLQDGTYAEYIALEEKHLAKKPNNLSFAESAVVPLSALTAYQSLFENIKLQKNEVILIHAGAGGVGGYAIQMAKLTGAYVITTATQDKEQYVKELGADEVIHYDQIDFVEAVRKVHPQGIDAVFDTVGGDTQVKSADVLKKGGRLVTLLAVKEDSFTNKDIQVMYVFVRPDSKHLQQIKEWVEKDQLKVRLTQTFPLEQAVKAHNMIENGRMLGKIALVID